MSFNFWEAFADNKKELYAANFGNASCPTAADDMHTATEVLLKRIANEAELAQNKPERLAQLQNLAVSITETYLANSKFGANNDISKLSQYMLDNLKGIIAGNTSITSKNPELNAKLQGKTLESQTSNKFNFWNEFGKNREILFDAGFGNSSCPTFADNMHIATEVLLKRIADRSEVVKNDPIKLANLQKAAASVTKTYLTNAEFGANNDISKLSPEMLLHLGKTIGGNREILNKYPVLAAKLQKVAGGDTTPTVKKKTSWLKRMWNSFSKKSKNEAKLILGVGMVAGVMAGSGLATEKQADDVKKHNKEIKVNAPKGLEITSVEEYNRGVNNNAHVLQPIINDERRSTGKGVLGKKGKQGKNNATITKKNKHNNSVKTSNTSAKVENKSFWTGIKEKFNNLFHKKQSALPVDQKANNSSIDNIIDDWYRGANQENMPSKVVEFAMITQKHKMTSEQYNEAISRLPEEFREVTKHASFCMRTNKKYKKSLPPSIAKEIASANEVYKARKEREHKEVQAQRSRRPYNGILTGRRTSRMQMEISRRQGRVGSTRG